MIKAAIIIERADIALGGAERSVLEMAGAIGQAGVDVAVLAAAGFANGKNLQVLLPGTKRASLGAFGNALRAHLKENHYDIIHSVLPFDFADVYQPRGGAYAESILRNADSYGGNMIRCYKTLTHSINFRRAALLAAEKKLCKNGGTTVAAISEYVKRQFIDHYGAGEERIALIPNGVKGAEKINTAAAEKLRSQILLMLGLGASSKAAIFLFAANNFRLKGLGGLIKAVAVSARQKKTRPLYLVVAGAGSSRRYRGIAENFKVSDRIAFLGPLRDIHEALYISDAAVLPSFYDPCSRFILEALTAGKPVITTRFNGASERFEDGRHGRIIESADDTEVLAGALNHFAEPENALQASKAIKEDGIAEKVSITKHAEQMIELYRSILRRKVPV